MTHGHRRRFAWPTARRSAPRPARRTPRRSASGPEDADVAFGADAPAGALSLAAEVEAVEPVGAESFLYCAAAGSRIVVRVSGRALAKPGDRLRVVAKAEKLHWFDAGGKRLQAAAIAGA